MSKAARHAALVLVMPAALPQALCLAKAAQAAKVRPAVSALDITEDALLGGQVLLRQPRRGYRVNVDSILLAAFAVESGRPGLTLDLGAGVGALSLLVHHLRSGGRFALIEREAPLLTLARTNLADAGAEASFFEHDLERGLPSALAGRADLVVSNPPYFHERNARPRAVGSGSRLGTLEPFLKATARALKGPRARAAFVYPARDLARLLCYAESVALVPKRLRFVQADRDTPARVALIELRRARAGGLVVLPALLEWQAPGQRSAELRALLAEPER